MTAVAKRELTSGTNDSKITLIQLMEIKEFNMICEIHIKQYR